MAGERTEAPTPRRLRDARQKGNVSKSQEIVSIGVLLVAVVGLRSLAPAVGGDMRDFLREGLGSGAGAELTSESAFAMGRDLASRAILSLLPLLAVLALAGIALNVAQTGLLLSGEGLKPKFSRVNPVSGAKRLISPDAAVNLAKALLKMATVSVVVWMSMRAQLAEIASLGQLGLGLSTVRLAGMAFDIAIRAAAVLFILAVADFGWQRRKWFKSLRMSKEELKQELKESDGDPHIRAAIRRRRQSLMNRMIAAVPKADVVVTNPTHYAVALKYDPVTMPAPTVLAKGERLLAQRIKEVARKAGVPVLEEPPLARALYASVAVGGYVPANLFHAVAEVLAWVYALRSRKPFAWRSRPAGTGV